MADDPRATTGAFVNHLNFGDNGRDYPRLQTLTVEADEFEAMSASSLNARRKT